MSDQNQDLFDHVAISPPHVDINNLTPKNYQIREVMLGKPTVDIAKLMVTIGMKEVFRHLEQDETKLINLWKHNEILRGYLNEVVGPLDPKNIEETLNVALEKREKENVQLDPFLKACQQWRESFEEKGVQIIQGNIKLVHHMQNNADKLVAILNKYFGLIDEVHTWGKDLQALQSIKGQRYRMLMDVYTANELDKIDDQIEKILDGNKVMETLHTDIHKLKDQTQEHILEAEIHYNDACLDIFEDDSRDRLMTIQAVVEKIQKTFEEASTDEDIR